MCIVYAIFLGSYWRTFSFGLLVESKWSPRSWCCIELLYFDLCLMWNIVIWLLRLWKCLSSHSQRIECICLGLNLGLLPISRSRWHSDRDIVWSITWLHLHIIFLYVQRLPRLFLGILFGLFRKVFCFLLKVVILWFQIVWIYHNKTRLFLLKIGFTVLIYAQNLSFAKHTISIVFIFFICWDAYRISNNLPIFRCIMVQGLILLTYFGSCHSCSCVWSI